MSEKSDLAILHANRIRDAVRTPCRTNSRIPIFRFVRLDHSNVSSARANSRIGPRVVMEGNPKCGITKPFDSSIHVDTTLERRLLGLLGGVSQESDKVI